jgi:hypothetical protein
MAEDGKAIKNSRYPKTFQACSRPLIGRINGAEKG